MVWREEYSRTRRGVIGWYEGSITCLLQDWLNLYPEQVGGTWRQYYTLLESTGRFRYSQSNLLNPKPWDEVQPRPLTHFEAVMRSVVRRNRSSVEPSVLSGLKKRSERCERRLWTWSIVQNCRTINRKNNNVSSNNIFSSISLR